MLLRQSIKASDTLGHQPTAWPVPYACALLYHYHPRAVAAMDSCFGLVRPHQRGIAVGNKPSGRRPGDEAVRMRKVLARGSQPTATTCVLWVIWLRACVSNWPGRELVSECVTFFNWLSYLFY